VSLGRSIFTVGGFTMLSRVTGFARDILIAAFLGAGTVADAFFVAFKFPNLFRRLFAEGAFNAAFVPLFAGKLEGDGHREAWHFAERSMAVLAWGLAAFVALMEIVMPWAMYAFAPGFDAVPGKMALATEMARITFPYLLFISLVSLQGGVLNSLGRFAAPAATPVLLNLTLMGALLALAPLTPTPGHALAWGTTAAGALQFAWLAVSLRRAGIPLRPVMPRLSPEVRLLMRRIVPGALGAGIYQVNLLIDTIIASLVADGAVSVLYYADRINQLPLGVVGIAVGTALLPVMSRLIRAGNEDAALHNQNRGLEVALLLTVPAAAALVTVAHPLIMVLFERGAFGPMQTEMTAQALAAFALGLPAYVLVKVLTPGFFAREDTATPVKVALAAMVANILFNLALMKPMSAAGLGHVGIALATSLSAWLNVGLLAWLLKKRGMIRLDGRLKARAPRILAASLGMAGILAFAQGGMGGWLAGPTAERVAALAALVAGGMAAFALLAHLSGAARLGDVKALLRRG
jgi:putative peptidoglycan lipid II flippase